MTATTELLNILAAIADAAWAMLRVIVLGEGEECQ
jgi:hypothetical protein